MPLSVPEHFGTNKGGSRNMDYCRFCYQDGRFTANLSMDEMIEVCAGYIDQWKLPDNRKISRDEAIGLMKEQFPLLKRWVKRKETESEYQKAVNQVIEYIDSHLSEEIELKKLARIAHISPYHFHRIFFSIIGENVGEYILRLKMEYAAGALLNNTKSLHEIVDYTGYQTVQSFSKAFKKHFGISPSYFRKKPTYTSQLQKEKIPLITPISEIKEVDSFNCIYIRIIDVYGSPKSYNMAWGKLYHFAKDNELINDDTEYIGLCFDDPTITSPNRCRFYACITVNKKVSPTGEFGTRQIKGGLYAVFTLIGPYSHLMTYYNYIYLEWLPKSKYKLRNSFSYEKYLNNPETTSSSALKTEIYIPVSPIDKNQ